MVETMVRCDIKDINLAEQGKNNIEFTKLNIKLIVAILSAGS